MTDRAAPLTGEASADPIQAPGTPESAWRAWRGLADLPLLDPVRALPVTAGRTPRVVVVAAHPDDEVLGFGGSLALLADAGVRPVLVSVTDGEASHPGSRSPLARDLRAVRTRELDRALSRLRVRAHRSALHLPDGRVGAHEEELTDRLARLLEGCDLCVAPYSRDLHPDHEAAGRAALAAGAARGVPVWEYPVWSWHWARPAEAALPWQRAARVQLPSVVSARKLAALDCFRSQLHPLGDGPGDGAILPPEELAHFQRDFEVIWQ
ncbi:GlcNAc-PI de-N-acetylase [Kitasatospora sp. MMS16-BH015]|uniref:PIG-L deacetylase family protein n=1 Tax=Kitasatospora sp. MMS16-BH015 TaxID=2018025 RepID=UPI000CA36C58|nr:PIG-L family deacetylase [Kitasatospora sp. MMS16-BH015]AUG81743.1 GlcNAc-PI de-N-acetylase [Kitasatospora sp. MMS16-BH015]